MAQYVFRAASSWVSLSAELSGSLFIADRPATAIIDKAPASKGSDSMNSFSITSMLTNTNNHYQKPIPTTNTNKSLLTLRSK